MLSDDCEVGGIGTVAQPHDLAVDIASFEGCLPVVLSVEVLQAPTVVVEHRKLRLPLDRQIIVLRNTVTKQGGRDPEQQRH